jgi:hypothetical protein
MKWQKITKRPSDEGREYAFYLGFAILIINDNWG